MYQTLEITISHHGGNGDDQTGGGIDERFRRAAREFGKLNDRGVEGLIWGDPDNYPQAVSVPVVTLGFKREETLSITSDGESFIPTFETGVLAGRLMIKIITGRPVPMREVIIKGAGEECL